MTVAKGNVSSSAGNLSSGFTFSHTVAAGADTTLVVGWISTAGAAITSITFGAISLSLVSGTVAIRNGLRTELWEAEGVSGTETVTVNHDGGMHHSGAFSVDFNGASTPSDGAINTDTAVSTSTINVANTTSDDFLIDAISTDSNPTAGADQTHDFDGSSGGKHMNGSTQDGVDGDAMSWTMSSSNLAHCACRIPAAVSDTTDEEWAGTLGFGQQEPVREPNEIVSY